MTAEIRAVERQLSATPPTPGSARILLNDLSPQGVGIYCDRHYVAGQEVAILMTSPTRIYLRGTVMYCQEQEHKTHVISETPYFFRMGIKFVFENAQEQANVAKYCEDLVNAVNRTDEAA